MLKALWMVFGLAAIAGSCSSDDANLSSSAAKKPNSGGGSGSQAADEGSPPSEGSGSEDGAAGSSGSPPDAGSSIAVDPTSEAGTGSAGAEGAAKPATDGGFAIVLADFFQTFQLYQANPFGGLEQKEIRRKRLAFYKSDELWPTLIGDPTTLREKGGLDGVPAIACETPLGDRCACRDGYAPKVASAAFRPACYTATEASIKARKPVTIFRIVAICALTETAVASPTITASNLDTLPLIDGSVTYTPNEPDCKYSTRLEYDEIP